MQSNTLTHRCQAINSAPSYQHQPLPDMEIWALLQLKFIINGWQKAEACELFMQINGSRKKCGWTLNNPFKVHFLVSNRVNQIYQCTGFSGFDWQYVEASSFQNDKKSERERERKKMTTKTSVKSWYCNLFTVGYLRRPPLFLNGLNPHFSNGILNLLFIIRITKPLDPVTVDWSNYGELKALRIICGREREKKRNQRKKECVVSHFNWALNGILHSVMRCSFEYG